MEEKGSGVYAYFQTKGIDLTTKKLAKTMDNIRKKQSSKIKLFPPERIILESCKELSVEPRTIRSWLEFLSVSHLVPTLN